MFYSLLFLSTLLIFYFFWYFKKRRQSQISSCCICEKVFKDKNIINIDELPFCKEDYQFYLKTNWIVLKQEIASSLNSENAMQIYNEKHLLLNNGIKCYIRTDYQEKNSHIISIFKLHCPQMSHSIAHNLLKRG